MDDELTPAAIERDVAKERGRLEMLLRATPDPLKPQNSSSSEKLSCREVVRFYEPDERGLVEVLYRGANGKPMTAFLRGDELAYVAEGW